MACQNNHKIKRPAQKQQPQAAKQIQARIRIRNRNRNRENKKFRLVLVFLCPSLESVRRIFQLVRRRKDGDQRKKKIKKARKAEISKAVSRVINRQRRRHRRTWRSPSESGWGLGILPAVRTELLADRRIIIIQTLKRAAPAEPTDPKNQADKPKSLQKAGRK